MGDIIDINVQVAVDEVTINATPNNYIINVNRIIGEQVQSDWNVTDDQAPDYIKNKPTIPSIEGLATVVYVDQQDALKVDKVVGKGLSTNDFTDILKTKLDGIQDGAEVNVNADWNATSGDAQILNKPTIPAAVTKTSDLTNDGADGVNPFITLNDIPPSITPNLQSVTDEGNTTTNVVIVESGQYKNSLGVSSITTENTTTGASIYLSTDDGIVISNASGSGRIKADTIALGNNPDFQLPNKSGTFTIATIDDIPTNGLPAGGTAGQILTKVDATDYNATWQENYADWTSVVKHTVKNNGLSGTITKGTAVYVTGSNGTNMLVGRASNVSESTSSKTMGLMQSNITTTGGTQTGFVITEGLIQGLNTAGQTAGDPVWLGVNGALIYGLANKPYAPAHLVFIGIVTKISAGNGEIFVKVQNGFELKEIHDVDLITTTPINGHLLGFDGTLWVNKTIAGWLGYTPISGTGTTNYLPKFTGTSALGNSLISESTNLININSASVLLDNNRFLRGKFVDGTVKDIIGINDGNEIVITGVGAFHFTNIPNVYIDATAVPTFNLSNSAGATCQLILESGATGNINIRGNGGTRLITLSQNGQMAVSKGTVSLLAQQTIYPYATTIKGQVIKGFTGQTANLQEWQDSIGTVLAAVTAAGNVGIGTTATAAKLQVNAPGALSTDIAFKIRNSADTLDLVTVNGLGTLIGKGFQGTYFYAGTTYYDNARIYIGSTSNAKFQTFTSGFSIEQGALTTIAPTAIFELKSTTQGFLPPRMTNAERLLIVTPAVGLCVYCTDIVEGLYINKSTGWTYIG